MDKEVVWSLRAAADLESIVEYIFGDSEFYATAVARELVAAARSLTTFAERGRMVREYEDPTVRQLIVRRCRLIYRVKPDRVEVLRIIHGAQEMPSEWKSSNERLEKDLRSRSLHSRGEANYCEPKQIVPFFACV